MANLMERKRRRRRKLQPKQDDMDEDLSHFHEFQENLNSSYTMIPNAANQNRLEKPYCSDVVEGDNNEVQHCSRLTTNKKQRNSHLSRVNNHHQSKSCLLLTCAICEKLPRLSLNLLLLLTTAFFLISSLMVVVSANGVNILNNNNRQQSQSQFSNGQPVITTPTSGGKGKYKTIYACEDRLLKMDCEFGSKINLIRANYGRFSITQCNEQGQLDLSTDCMSPITFRIMQERCQDKQKCSVNATSSLFGDKCPKTRKYLEVHFQCHPDLQSVDKVDLRNSSSIMSTSHLVYPQPPSTSVNSAGTSPILPPNNPTMIMNSGSSSSSSSIPQPSQINNNNNPIRQQQPYPNFYDDNTSPSSVQQQQQQQQQQQPKPYPQPPPQFQPPQKLATMMNSEIISYTTLTDSRPIYNNPADPSRLIEPLIVTFRHTTTENVSNPRCVLWDPVLNQWTERGSQIIMTNITHTTCAFEQASSYLLIVDWLNTQPTISQTNPLLFQDQPSVQIATQPSPVPQFGPPLPNILEQPPVVLDRYQSQWNMNKNQQQPQQPQLPPQQQPSSSVMKSFSLFGCLVGIVFVVVILITIAFIASTMRSSAGAALKSLGNFTAFGGQKYKGRRADESLHNKDLLVINNQNGHQFLYAPANATKLNSSASTHILGSNVANQHQNTLHQIQQQQLYSGNGTLSNLSGTGGQSNNYYYGLMGFNNLFQQQQQSQMQHHLSQHHLNQQQQAHQMQQTLPAPTNYHHQANKSTISTESANSTPSSSGVESGSTGIQQQSHLQQQSQQQQPCLVMNSDYNLMGQLANYGHQQALLSTTSAGQQQPTLTLNTHYASGTSPASIIPNQQRLILANQQQQQQQLATHQNNGQLREHIYECVDDDKPYNGRMLLPSNLLSSEQFNSNTLSQAMNLQQQQQNSNLTRTMTLSSRILQNAIQQQQQQQLNQVGKRLFSHPAIVRDNQTKTNTICSKLAQVTPQRATAINNKFQHDVMAIYNGTETTTTTATTSAANSINCYSTRQELNDTGSGNNKLSTDC